MQDGERVGGAFDEDAEMEEDYIQLIGNTGPIEQLGSDLLINGVKHLVGGNSSDRLSAELQLIAPGEEGTHPHANPVQARVFGLGGDDLIYGSLKADVLDGDDVIYTFGAIRESLDPDDPVIAEIVRGGEGNDVVYSGINVDAPFHADGGNGELDKFSFVLGTSAKILRVDTEDSASFVIGPDAEGDYAPSEFHNFEVFEGTDHADTFDFTGLDTAVTAIGGRGGDALTGGDSLADTLDYSTSEEGVHVRLWKSFAEDGDAEGDVIGVSGKVSAFENLRGSDQDDILHGSKRDNVIEGGAGADDMRGGRGNDTLDYSRSDEGVRVNLSTGQASGGHAKGDTFLSFENLTGSEHSDELVGDDGNNILTGNGGKDQLIGGAGDDVFVFAVGDGVDRVRDFEHGDTIRFVGIESREDLTLDWRKDTLLEISYGDGDELAINGEGLRTGFDFEEVFEFV